MPKIKKQFQILQYLPLAILFLLIIFFAFVVNGLSSSKANISSEQIAKSFSDATILQLPNHKEIKEEGKFKKNGDDIDKSNKNKAEKDRNNQLQQKKNTASLAKITIINFFSSWCGNCLDEHEQMLKFKSQIDSLWQNSTQIVFYGVAWRDLPENSTKFLISNSNPYDLVFVDSKNKIGKIFNISGVPETFIINSKGEIIYRHVGNIKHEQITQMIKIINKEM